jgi:hypothetical protein
MKRKRKYRITHVLKSDVFFNGRKVLEALVLIKLDLTLNASVCFMRRQLMKKGA